MIYKRFDDRLVIKLDKNDNLVASIKDVLKKENILAGSISGIGASNHLDMGVFNPEIKNYERKIYDEDLEITCILGNVSQKDGEVYTHLHITCGRSDGSAIAGHLNEAKISLTCEIFVDIIDGKILRGHDKDLGIDVISF